MSTINSQEDFLRALSENPEWRAAVRAQILGEELLQLPARFDAFVDQMTRFMAKQEQFNAEITEFVAEQKRFNDRIEQRLNALENDVSALRDDVSTLKGDVNTLKGDMSRMATYFSNIKGHYTRAAAISNAAALSEDMNLEYADTLTQAELVRMARRGRDLDIPANELRSFREADLVIRAENESGVEYIAVEASYTADSRDTGRALRNARFLMEFTGRPAQAAVASVRKDNEIEDLISSGSVYWYETAERDVEPE